MNFKNPEYDGKRGVDPYKEFIPTTDKSTGVYLAQSMASAIQAVHGRTYTVEQEYSLYPTSGTSEDYSFSRYFIDNNNEKIFHIQLNGVDPIILHRFIHHTLKCRTSFKRSPQV